MNKLILLASTSLLPFLLSPAQGASAIHTGGAAGAYYGVFCPPLAKALDKKSFTFSCTQSKGTGENIERILAKPSDLALVQLDVFARWAQQQPELAKKLTVIRNDIACEGLWLVVKNVERNSDITNFGDFSALSRRKPLILPPQNSGSVLTWNYLQTFDLEGIGSQRAKDQVTYADDVTKMLNKIAAGDGREAGFFVQFADPQNVNIKLIDEKGLRAVKVVSRDLVNAQVDGKNVYDVQTFNLKDGFFTAKEETTSCTPVAVITGSLTAFSAAGDQAEQKDLIKLVSAIPSSDLLPQESRLAKIISSAKKIGGKALDEMIAAAEAARKKAEELSR